MYVANVDGRQGIVGTVGNETERKGRRWNEEKRKAKCCNGTVKATVTRQKRTYHCIYRYLAF